MGFSLFSPAALLLLLLDMQLIVSGPAFAQERPYQEAGHSGSQNPSRAESGASQDSSQDSRRPAPDPKQAATFAGTVVKDGEEYDLRDSSGETFKLDDAARAKAFAGRTVKVTGELDAASKVIHIENIVSVEG